MNQQLYATMFELGRRHVDSQGSSHSVLAILDENLPEDALVALRNIPGSRIITNRYDVHAKSSALGIPSTFSDNRIDGPWDIVLYRIAKERPVCHTVFNQLRDQWHDGARLILAGRKNEGVKGYHQKLIKSLGMSGRLEKNGDTYHAELTCSSWSSAWSPLDDKQYEELRLVKAGDTEFYSKPGIYGWNKIDDGSRFLIDTLASQQGFTDITDRDCRVLDLGCGYGYLSTRLLHARGKNLPKYLCATDNNAAAIAACAKNIAEFPGVAIDIIPDDCASTLVGNFDLILCNPPFHQGFEVSRAQTEKFARAAARRISPEGCAYFVVNAFVPLENIATQFFSLVKQLANNRQFKVLALSKPLI